jgi:hypothetical protein
MEKISWANCVKCAKYYIKQRTSRHTIKRRKANWIGHILHRNYLLKHVTEGKREGRCDGKTTKKM